MLGLTAYRAAFRVRSAPTGRQAEPFEGAELWVLPNPSGLNAHPQLDDLAQWYRAAAEAAGVPPSDPIGAATRHIHRENRAHGTMARGLPPGRGGGRR